METTREMYQAKMEEQLKQWTNRLAALRAKADMTSASAKRELLADLAELKKLELAAKEHLAGVKGAVATSWDEVRADVTDKWNHVSGAVDAIWARLR